MNNLNPAVGQPIRSAQTCLRKIAYTYKDIPLIIPDGIYGTQTMECVKAFQNKYGLPVTGEIDYETWDKIMAVYEQVSEMEAEPFNIKIFPGTKTKFFPEETSPHLFPIQSVMLLLTEVFPELGNLSINGIHDKPSVHVVQNLQKIFGMETTGVIEKKFWNQLVLLYEAHVSRNRF